MEKQFKYDVFLSHSSKDKEVVRELAERLKKDGRRVWFDEWETLPGNKFDDEIRRGLDESRTLIYFISKAASNYENVVRARQIYMFRNDSERHLVPVLIEDCDIPIELREIVYVDWRKQRESEYKKLLDVCRTDSVQSTQQSKPAGYSEKVEEDTPNIKESISVHVPEFSNYSFSVSVRRILEEAIRINIVEGSVGFNSLDLLKAFIRIGSKKREPINGQTPFFFYETINKLCKPDLLEKHIFANQSSGPIGPIVEQLSPNSRLIFQAAQSYSQKAGHGGEIHARHLLLALLAFKPEPDNLYGFDILIDGLGISKNSLFERFTDFYKERFPKEAAMLGKVLTFDSADQNSKSSSISANESTSSQSYKKSHDTDSILCGFQNDNCDGQDLLDISVDVNAIASLVAAWSVEPPLSIGLFGEWGSGKTFFMHQIKKRVSLLSHTARESKLRQRNLGYCRNIVQIEFNAWHYMEGNLWASLVEHIFSNLKLEGDNECMVELRRRELLTRLAGEQVRKDKATRLLDPIRTDKQEAEKKVAEIRKNLKDQSNNREVLYATLSASIRQVVHSDSEIENLFRHAGLDSDSVENVKEIRDKFEEFQSLYEQSKSFLRLASGRLYLKRTLAVIILSAIAIPLLGYLFDTLKNFLHIPAIFPQILAGIIAFGSWSKPIFNKLGSLVSTLKQKQAEIEKADNETKQKTVVLETKISILETQYAAAEADVREKEQRIAKIEHELSDLSASQLLAEWIEDRAKCTDYRQQLGLVALIRRDFEQMERLFKAQRLEISQENKVEPDKSTNSEDSVFNRIILYIDDLDRCPPERVVEVLQAIHLLLAFPMFVVIVGVDSRWVSKSLEKRFVWLQEKPDGGNEAGKANGFGLATSHDYLEKIFQIPFWLRPMEPEACKNLLRSLTQNMKESTHDNVSHTQSGDDSTQEPPSESEDAPSITSDSNNNEPIVNTDSPVIPVSPTTSEPDIDLNPKSLELKQLEIDLIDDLAPIIGRSPRAAKRFLNCYRLIKVRLDENAWITFYDNDCLYKEVMVLLAIITGAPDICEQLVQKLLDSNSVNILINRLEKDSKVKSSANWERVKGCLSTVGLSTEQMIKAIPFVERFSFKHIEITK